uniref:Uncharacterized protein n=1 Tax=Cucumis melo TaxID=3656 RepID=A0A9I9ELA5_CUCME
MEVASRLRLYQIPFGFHKMKFLRSLRIVISSLLWPWYYCLSFMS